MISVVTNIDADHLETYGGDFAKLRGRLHRIYPSPAVLRPGCAVPRRPGDPRIIARHRPPGAHVWAGTRRRSARGGHPTPGCRRALRGAMDERPSARNSISTCRAATTCRTPWRRSRLRANSASRPARSARRFRISPAWAGVCESHGVLDVAGKRVLLIDDYGHHPREIAATFSAVREAYPKRRLVVAFQPHRYTRTQQSI